MANLFKNLFNKKGDSVVGVDIGSSSIKVVQLRKKGAKALLETYGELSLGAYGATDVGRATNLGADKLSEALRDIIKEAKVTTNVAGLAIPFSASLMTVMEMPNLPEKQLQPMIPIEARKYIPVPISEVQLDWWLVPKVSSTTPEPDENAIIKKGDKLDVLVVAIHNDILKKYQQIVEETHLQAGFLEIEIFSTIRSTLNQEIAPVMIVDMGAATTKLYVVERGVIQSSHSITRGGQDITLAISQSLATSVTNAEVLKRAYGGKIPQPTDKNIAEIMGITLDYVFSETNRLLNLYQRKYNKNIGKVILVGGGAKMHGILDLAKKNLQTEAILGDPFAKTETPAFLEDVLRTTGPEFTVAVGAALRSLGELR